MDYRMLGDCIHEPTAQLPPLSTPQGPRAASATARRFPRQRTAPSGIALYPAAEVRQAELPVQPWRTPRKHRLVLSRQRTAAEHLAPDRAARIAAIDDPCLSPLSRGPHKLVRWHRQLLTLVDALEGARIQQGEAEFRKLGISPAVKKSHSTRS